MLEIISNIASHKNSFFDKDDNYFNMNYKSDLSQSVFNQFNQYLLSEKIKFNNFFIKTKKVNNNDKNILCSNFIINNLLDILNKKDISFNSKEFNNIINDKIQKKKIDKDQNNSLDTIYNFKKIKDSQKNKNKEILKIFKTEKLPNKLKKNKYRPSKINRLNNINIKNDLYLKNINISNIHRNNIKTIEDEKKTIFPLYLKRNKNISCGSKNINKIDNIINRKNLLKIFNKEKYVKSNIKPLILNNTQNSIEWKKLISHKILLSISNKNNEATIHFKPESLGSIHILINMKNNAAKLQFFSKCNNIRTFLDRYMPVLRHSLMKNDIKLEEFNIFNSLKKNKNLKIYKNLFDKHIYNVNNSKKRSSIYRKDLDFIKQKTIDLYV